MKNDGGFNRREFNRLLLAALVSVPAIGCSRQSAESNQNQTESLVKPSLKLSLSQWALHYQQFGGTFEQYQQWQEWLKTDPSRVLQGPLSPVDFPKYAQDTYDVSAVDLVNTFFFAEVDNQKFWQDYKQRCGDNGIVVNTMMCDQLGFLGHEDKQTREASIKLHKQWLDACAMLGCRSMRVNVHGTGDWQSQLDSSSETVTVLADYAQRLGLRLLIENHGGLSSNADWLIELLTQLNHPSVKIMLDYDNFKWSATEIWQTAQVYDRYKGFEMLIPYTDTVSVKTYDFDRAGNETTIDVAKMVALAQQYNFEGYHSVEYEGGEQHHLSIHEGIVATKALLIREW